MNVTENHKNIVLSLIPKTENEAITSRELMDYTGFTFRYLKAVISELRNEYPIVSKETDGGGYWIAEDKQDIKRFISMINARKHGYEETVNKMIRHLISV